MAHGHDLIGTDEQAKTEAEKRWARRGREKARRRGGALAERLVQASDLRPGGAVRFVAVVFGPAVHGLTLLVPAGAVTALFSGNWLLSIVAALGFGIVWLMRPRLGSRPGAGWLTRADLPMLSRWSCSPSTR